MNSSISLILLLGVLALSPWKEGMAQAGSEEGSTGGSSGTMGIPEDTGNRGVPGSPGTTGTESGTQNRGTTGSPGTTGTESDIQNRENADPSGTTGTESGTPRENTGGMGTKKRSGSETYKPSNK
jgi:hypothetical protein